MHRSALTSDPGISATENNRSERLGSCWFGHCNFIRGKMMDDKNLGVFVVCRM